MMFVGSQMQVHLMPTELFVRRPLLWLQFASESARHHPVLAELRLPALPQGAGRPLGPTASISLPCA
jgi:hypothetical protein